MASDTHNSVRYSLSYDGKRIVENERAADIDRLIAMGDGAEILRRLNSHDALVEALESLLRDIPKQRDVPLPLSVIRARAVLARAKCGARVGAT